MLTAKTSIAATNSPSGNLLYTHPSGMRSSIIDLECVPYDTSSDYNVDVIEVYPTGNPPTMDHTTTGVIMTTRSTFPVTNARIYPSSSMGSEVRVIASGQCEVYCNYVYTQEPLNRWAGFNVWNEKGVG